MSWHLESLNVPPGCHRIRSPILLCTRGSMRPATTSNLVPRDLKGSLLSQIVHPWSLGASNCSRLIRNLIRTYWIIGAPGDLVDFRFWQLFCINCILLDSTAAPRYCCCQLATSSQVLVWSNFRGCCCPDKHCTTLFFHTFYQFIVSCTKLLPF